MTTQNLLVELFVEELPPKALNKLGAAFSGVLAEQLKTQGLAAADAVVTAFASPRRLAAHVTGVLAQGADKAVQQKLMPWLWAWMRLATPPPRCSKNCKPLGPT
jgi:glycyl-tRNA synthetase beta chain